MAENVIISEYFSRVSSNYVNYRPSYPTNFFEFLSNLTSSQDLALDVATGNGQAATKLADFFKHVMATDPSDKQLEKAVKKGNVEYLCLSAEMTEEQCEQNGFKKNSFDLITCATAIHWIDVHKFFDVAKSLLKKGDGIMAIFTYDTVQFGNAEVDQMFQSYMDSLKPLVKISLKEFGQEGYKQLHFPFEHVCGSWEENGKKFAIEVIWSLEDLKGFAQSMSLTQLATEKWGYDPTEKMIEKLKENWGPEHKRKIRFPVIYRIGRNSI